MSYLVTDCPRCGIKNSMVDIRYSILKPKDKGLNIWELFAECRECTSGFLLKARARKSAGISTVDVIRMYGGFVPHADSGSLDDLIEILGPVSLEDFVGGDVPEHLPDPVRRAFAEGTMCIAGGCPNAAAAMFRLAMDLATKEQLDLVPPTESQPPAEAKNNLSKRLQWLFDNNLLPGFLKELAKTIRENGNDGAHDGSLSMDDAYNLYDFSEALLAEIYTNPGRLKSMAARRAARRGFQ